MVANQGVRKEAPKMAPLAPRHSTVRSQPRSAQKENVRNTEVFSTKLGDARRMAVSQMAQADGCALEAIGRFDKMLAELRGALVDRVPSQSKPVAQTPDLFAEIVVQETAAAVECGAASSVEPRSAAEQTEEKVQNIVEVLASTTPRVSFGRDGGI